MWHSGKDSKCMQSLGTETRGDHLEELEVDGKILLTGKEEGLGFMGLRTGTSGGLL